MDNLSKIKKDIRVAKGFAPATCANVAVGFDILGFSFESIGDEVTLTQRKDKQIIIESIDSPEPLPDDIHENTASVVIQKLCQHLRLEIGFSIHIKKGIPLSSGMGGSAASAVAALMACQAFLTVPLSKEELAYFALFGEEVASGSKHADNIIPCLYGGMTLIQSLNPIQVVSLPVPSLYCVLIHPHLHVATREARAVLKPNLSLSDYTQQSAYLAAFISALYEQDLTRLKLTMHDILIEPQRAKFVPGFDQIKDAALRAGAIGMSFSGSGPAMFAFAKTKQEAKKISEAMCLVLQQRHINADAWISKLGKNRAAHFVITS